MVIEKYGIRLRTVEITDAEFILKLRTDSKLSQFISETNPDVAKQLKWIEQYKRREEKKEEFYFVAEDADGECWGTTRVYNVTDDDFEIGSWVFKPNAPNNIAVKADILTREFGFSFFKKQKCVFQVDKRNKKVLKYHKAYGPLLLHDDETNYYFSLTISNFEDYKNKLIKIIS